MSHDDKFTRICGINSNFLEKTLCPMRQNQNGCSMVCKNV